MLNNTELINEYTKLLNNLDTKFVSVEKVIEQGTKSVPENISKYELNEYMANVAASMTYLHPDYSYLAGRILMLNIHAKVPPQFYKCMKALYDHNKIIDEKLLQIAQEHVDIIESKINYSRDFDYTYFGVKTLENGYLLKIDDQVAERPQHMLMRVAIGIHGTNLENAFKTYYYMSSMYFTHASPTMFSAGTRNPQMSSCFLTTVKEDSIAGIYKTLHDCATISKYGGGIGLSVQNIRARGSKINSTNGVASGLEPMLRVFNNMVRHVDQGGKRKGALAVYVEPWHADIYSVLSLKKNMGAEDSKARDLMYALWVPDLFMKRVELDEMWSLMCPYKCKGLDNCYGEEFEKLYTRYEREQMYERQVRARDLHRYIIETQVETGGPYMLFKDACNAKSNQKHYGVIRCSNLCAEIMQYCDANETSVCNLASIAVNKFVVKDREGNAFFDFKMLHYVTQLVVLNLDTIIDKNFYPIEEAKRSNSVHRPMGVGIQGLADAFMMMRYPYESEDAKLLNQQIAETIYHAALTQSMELAEGAKQRWHCYELGDYYTEGVHLSPASKGILQYDMWNVKPTSLWDWDKLKEQIENVGLRNSLLVAYMPTATTAQILGNNESFEPFTSNVYVRRVLAGEFQVVNKHLVADLIKRNLYNENVVNDIIANRGSVQNLDYIPDDLKLLYKTAWEMKVKCMIDMAADRGAFIDQSQSLNLFVAEPTYALMSSIHHYAWKKGLKTGMYYLRTKPAAHTQQFTVAPKRSRQEDEEETKCKRQRTAADDCVSCQA
ncbi:ribonucleotide reductase, large subunit [Spodoptera exempta nucleopolyhedrovirus]|uniref:Ribonucleoside-diphosphate reductase n=1 Tax=Spodoptera exempta nucleopolyhedrovirus TaxID=1242863 RepID=A0A410S7Z2_9ABAC|nr:ribonucleotide reductase, large subunit [Spodoptera exempta nucleopolyhedrovirus]QAT90423.1 ribonucleotide reductase, large subunit [Spodoptera exempta nucleopolyhedrovirus]